MSLIPEALLQKSNKILFVAHLAIGDFTYWQNCFRAFAQQFPHIKMHLWVDELRRTDDQTKWNHLKKYALYDWVRECNLFEKIYTETYSPASFEASIQQAQTEHYPIVVSLAVLHRHKYVKLIRRISPGGFVVGQKKRVRLWDIPKHLIYRKLDAHIPAYKITRQQQSAGTGVPHISAIYADWFLQLFNLDIPEAERFPYVDIPLQWLNHAQQQFNHWRFFKDKPTIFVNGFSKSPERSLSLGRVFRLVELIRSESTWSNANFIVNVVPEALAQARQLFAQHSIDGVHLFSADENFFQLPAVLSLCDLVVSVETATMHLANAVHVPLVALMRQTSPEWVPFDKANSTVIKTSERKAWVDQISDAQIIAALPNLSSLSSTIV
jgi:ADP-heptose:LPS heptosyltransferase